MTMELNFEQDLRIDHNALDEEWLNQPNLFFHYSKALADAKKQQENEKTKLDIVYAQFDTEIRAGRRISENIPIPEKITEAVVKSTIEQNADYQKQLAIVSNCKHATELLEAAVKAMYQRKEALENLVKLLGMQYFSAPKEPRNLDTEMGQPLEAARSRRVGKLLNNKKES
jgi:hypothetical protein